MKWFEQLDPDTGMSRPQALLQANALTDMQCLRVTPADDLTNA